MEEQAPPTLSALLSGDTSSLILSTLDSLPDLGAVSRCLLPLRPAALNEAVEEHGRRLVAAAPLCCCAGDFATEALRPPEGTLAASRGCWQPRPFFGALCAQSGAKDGVLDLLARLVGSHRGEAARAPAGEEAGCALLARSLA